MTMQRVGWILLLLLSFQALAGTGALTSEVPPPNTAPTGGDFTLESITGPVSTTEFRGKVILLYFGYTHCPDVCPTALSRMTQALNSLTERELERVVGIFVSLDPKRDSVEKLATYVGYFHDNFIGVTGSSDQVSAVSKRYGVQYRYTAVDDSAMGYVVDHSSAFYLIDQQGELRFALPHETPPETLIGAIRMLFEDISQP